MAFWSNVCSGRSCCCRRRRSLLAQCGRPRTAQDNRPPPGGLVNDQPTSSSLSYTTCLFEGKNPDLPLIAPLFLSLTNLLLPHQVSSMKIYQLQLVASQNAQPVPSFRLGPLEIYVLLMARCFTLLFHSSRSNRGRVSSILNAARTGSRAASAGDSDLLPFECFG